MAYPDRYWRPASNMAPSEFYPDAPLPGPPPVPPKPPSHVHSNVAWRPPSRTYHEEASIAERAYVPQAPPPPQESRTMATARRRHPYPGGRYLTPREEMGYATAASASGPPPVPEKDALVESTHAAAAWRRTQAEMREEGAGSGLRYLVLRTWLNALLLVVPFAWLAHFLGWNDRIVFALCFVGIVPLQIVLDFLGAQLTLQWGKTMGGLIAVTIGK
ncbi:hypothetical protein CALVIDRAFT_87333 [Calocera viscosa TUFC12733]|uniref:Uncharacterized protein n=1 Tax=Calocera viscosa (strain TUFC12733) TaxID=1330018 RepID=A0A167N6D4_CALVF|nr:hypothetical protein CALVIDRAFT_87333 [Calocera viscosa TUFC12733]